MRERGERGGVQKDQKKRNFKTMIEQASNVHINTCN